MCSCIKPWERILEKKVIGGGYWDIHNHMLPGLDDGSGSMEETMELLSVAYVQGVRHIVFTPHYREKLFEVSADDREQVFRQVAERACAEFPDLELFLGCEYHIGKNTAKDMQGLWFCMAGQNVVLAEFSAIDSYQRISLTVEQIQDAGYQVIIAHPERYDCLREHVEYVQSLHNSGAMLQLNADSILGYCGWSIKRFCKKILKANLVDVIASDTHDLDYRPMRLEQCAQWIRRKFGEERVERLFRKNPEILICPEREKETDKWNS